MNQSRGLPEWVNGRVTASHKIGTTHTTAQVKYSLCYGESEDQNSEIEQMFTFHFCLFQAATESFPRVRGRGYKIGLICLSLLYIKFYSTPYSFRRGQNFCLTKSQECQDWYVIIGMDMYGIISRIFFFYSYIMYIKIPLHGISRFIHTS